ncbi:MAG: DUF4331 domain-containing protein [Acidobacteria bacterium]|nr:DUF4331 domain-containing protein [Acidobacteriota bacterium]
MRRLLRATHIGLLVISMLAAGTFSTAVRASSHREAPSTAVDPMADGTDVYAFVDPIDPTRVTLIMNFIPFQLPQGGPNFYRFDDNIQYAMRIDNNGDAVTDIQYVFRFNTQVRNPNTFLYNTGPVTSLNDPDLNIRQFYSISVIRGNAPNTTTTTITPATAAAGSPAGFPFAVPPVNVGPRSTPDYETNLAQPAVTTVSTANGDARVFAGQREEGFFVDVGSAFDLFGLRPFNSAHLIPRANTTGVDGTAGFNVSTIAMQVPIAAVTRTGALPTGPSDPNAVISVYSASSRTAMIAFAEDRSGRVTFSGNFVQVSRLGNPLVNELLIPLAMKDRFNASLPGMDAQFLNFVLDPEPARLLGYPGAAGSPGKQFDLYPSFDAPVPPRVDVANVFLTGLPGLNLQTNTSGNPSVAAYTGQPANTVPQERLRLNLAIPPTAGTASAAGTANRLGVLGGDNAGFPNGRRVGDDVVDIELRVLAGVLAFASFNVAPNNLLGDGVNQNDVPFLTVFPYLATPRSGYDSPTSTAVGTTDTNAAATATASPTPRP